MGTLDIDDIRLFSMSFKVYKENPHYIELQSNSSQH